MAEAIEELLAYSTETVQIFHHNDTDGLSSGTILDEAFSQAGYSVERFSLEKPYPQVLEKIFENQGRIIIFTDFAGRISPLISELNHGSNLVLILDHHPAEDTEDPSVHVLDGELYNLKGDRDISASATCFLFAQSLSRKRGFSSDHLSHLGVLGAIGDGFFVDGALSGVNADILKIAEDQRLIRTVISEGENAYFIVLGGKEYEADRVCQILDTVGGVGYYSGGTDLGVEICKNGLDQNKEETVVKLLEKRDHIFSSEIERLKEELITTENLQWFDVKDRFQPMGVKMIGVFCTQIKDSQLVEKSKYLAGFQYIPDEVPGFGKISFNSTKISMRVSQYITDKIRAEEMAPLNRVLPEATKILDGFVDACHGLSAATTVKIGQESRLIEEIENILQVRMV